MNFSGNMSDSLNVYLSYYVIREIFLEEKMACNLREIGQYCCREIVCINNAHIKKIVQYLFLIVITIQD